VHQDAALQVPPGGPQLVRVLRQPHRLPLDAAEQVVGQDQVLAADVGEFVEPHRDVAAAVLFHGEHLAAERGPEPDALGELAGEPLRRLAVGTHDFGLDALRPVVALGDEQGDRLAAVAERVQPLLHTRELLVVGQLNVHVLDRPLLVPLRGRRARQLRQRDARVLVGEDDADEHRRRNTARHQFLGGEVQVGPLVGLELLLDDGQLGRVGAEVLAESGEQRGRFRLLAGLLRLRHRGLRQRWAGRKLAGRTPQPRPGFAPSFTGETAKTGERRQRQSLNRILLCCLPLRSPRSLR
jgi:hypothetical protein